MKFVLTLALLLTTSIASAKTVHPKTTAELREVTVRIMNLEMTSGGTGSIFKSFDNATHILTNKHICRLIEPGGVVLDNKGEKHLVTHYKKFPDHDLCLIRVDGNMGIDLEVSGTLAKATAKSVVSGHPHLLPHIATVGHLTDQQDIQLMVGVRECTKEEMKTDPLLCMFVGGMPVLETLTAQVSSNMIQPGNSGSAVFNKDGEIIGVVFAGEGGDFSYAFLVPQINILYFIQTAHLLEFVAVGTPVDDKGVQDRVFNYDIAKCRDVKGKTESKYDSIKRYCKSADTLIWRK